MAKKKQLIVDATTGELSRLQAKDLPLIGIDGLNDGDPIAPFGTLTSDIIEYCLYDTDDNYLASGELEYPLPNSLDIGSHVRNLGFERGTYKVVYNFLRKIGGSNKTILTKKSDKTIFVGQFMVETDGRILASHSPTPDINIPLLDENGKEIELLVQEDKYFIQEISPTRTEIRLRPNPAINDLDYFEQFRLLGFTCLSYSDVSGESNITFSGDGKTATINSGNISLNDAMEGGTLKIREAFIVDYEETPEKIERYTPVVDNVTSAPFKSLVTNGHFADEKNISELGVQSNNQEIVEYPNPGASRYVLKTTGGSSDDDNRYQLLLNGIPGESYIMSCWVYWDQDWSELRNQIFSGKVEVGGTEQSFSDSQFISERKNVGMTEWVRVYQTITLPVDGNGSFKLNLGLTEDVDEGCRYITNVQVEAGSSVGEPTPYMKTGERVEEEDTPTSGLITFADPLSQTDVKATFAPDDSGFTESMIGGKLTIKDAYVVDQNYTQDNELVIIDEIPLRNADASDIKAGEREFRVSPYHGTAQDNKIILQVDNAYDLFSINSAGTQTLLGSGNDWREAKEFILPTDTASLRVIARNGGGPGGILAKVFFNGDVVKTGEGRSAYDFDAFRNRWQNEGFSSISDVQDRIERFTSSAGPWTITSVTNGENQVFATENNPIDWRKIADAGRGDWGSNVHPDLADCDWIWSISRNPGGELDWNFTGGSSITDLIWQYWDPDLHSDAVWPENWSYGFNSFNFGGEPDRAFDRSLWHSGWSGYHAKWLENEGEFGGTAVKFIDQNSEFDAPNHENYQGLYRTGFVTTADSPNEQTTLTHRWMGVAQTLPHKLVSQGVQPGDQLTISWNQKTDTSRKGAMVGLYFYKKSDGNRTWGANLGNHPSTLQEGDKQAFEREFFRYIPVSKVGEWERVSFNAVIEEDMDLTKPVTMYIRGNYGPEGILWVESPQVQISENNNKVDALPVTTDLVGEITEVDGDTATLITDYLSLAPDGAIYDNEANIQRWNTFTEFYVDYTSSIAETSPVYGSLRGDIESINNNSITLKNTYAELGEQDGHDFDNDLNINESSTFTKWFVQYPNENQNNLSKLLKLGPNDYSLITNFKFDTQEFPEYPHALVYKLYEPLPEPIQDKSFVNIVREMIPPKEESVTLFPFVEEFVGDIVLKTPEFNNTDSPIGAGSTEFKNRNQLVSSDPDMKENIENEVLSGSLSADINVEHHLFENFIHFSSAETRVKNFKTKLDRIEQYTDRSASLAGAGSGSAGLQGFKRVKADPGAGSYLLVSGTDSYSPAFTPISGSLTQIQHWERLRREEINSFDKFEKYMFEQSSSFSSQSIGLYHDNAWPKESGEGTYTNPYILYRTSQSKASNWYSEQILSASAYDRANKHRLQGHLPMFVQDDDQNEVFLKFVDMIGHHFDDLWVFIKSMTDVHDKRDKLTEGIARNLIHPVAQSLGWTVHDGKSLIALPQYMFGMQVSGSEKPVEFGTTAERDISREIWSRILNNMPYFLKTKGTARAIKGLISCYGIPSSILRVTEYGGPALPGNSPDNFLTRKFTKALDFFGKDNNTYVSTNSWFPVISGSATNRVPDTVELRFKVAGGSDGTTNQILVRRGNDWAITVKDNGSTDTRGYVSFMLSGSHGYNEISSSEMPLYDGEFYSVMLTRTTGGSAKNFIASDTGSQNVDYNLFTKKYDAGRSKIVYQSEVNMAISGSVGIDSGSYNVAYSGSGTTITLGGPESGVFGESLSGSMMEYRNWTTALQESSFDNHVAAPIAFDGNTPSASYLDLVTRYSFDDDKDLSNTANQWFQDVTADQSFTASASPSGYTSGLANAKGTHFSSVVDEQKMKVPNLGPSGRSSNKIRIEKDERIDKVGNPVLKFGESITIPSYDKAPVDSNKLGVFFSPSAAIDEDIILSMPNLDFDQYIGDPRDQYNEQYTGLTEARNLYWQKYSGPNNFWDYLRLLKYYDAALYKQVADLVPARANATIGILIEPTVLERDKIIIGKEPTWEKQHHVTIIDMTGEYSESAEYKTFEDNVNWSVPFGINKHKNVTGSYLSSSAQYETFEANLTYTDPFRVNYYTQLSGSEPRGFISASAMELTPEFLNTLPLNFYDPHRINNRTQVTGSTISFSADIVSYNAPTDTLSQNAAGTGSFVLKHILERPSIYNIGDYDDSGYYGADYSGSTIQMGSVKTIFEEVVMPRIDTNVLSRFNDEIEFFYTSSADARDHKPTSSSFVRTDLDSRWDEAVGTDRLFYVGCVQDDASTVSDDNQNYGDNTPAIETTLVSPTKLTTTDKPSTKMDVKNK